MCPVLSFKTEMIDFLLKSASLHPTTITNLSTSRWWFSFLSFSFLSFFLFLQASLFPYSDKNTLYQVGFFRETEPIEYLHLQFSLQLSLKRDFKELTHEIVGGWQVQILQDRPAGWRLMGRLDISARVRRQPTSRLPSFLGAGRWGKGEVSFFFCPLKAFN